MKTSGTNLEHARAHNRRVVIEAIRLHGELTRAELARMTALTPQTVSNIVAELEQAELLTSRQPRRSGRGQPSIPVTLNPTSAWSIGIHLDHQRCCWFWSISAAKCVSAASFWCKSPSLLPPWRALPACWRRCAPSWVLSGKKCWGLAW